MKYDNLEQKIIQFLQGNIPIQPHPYAQLAASLGLTEDEVLVHIKDLQTRGWLRRLGAILYHQRAGFKVNAMVAWKVEEDQADKAGMIMAQFPLVSHCYLRAVPEGFDYNLFTMVHAHSEEQLQATVNEMSCCSRLTQYRIIRSVRELKKVSMTYF